eukprot:4008738-Prymnesium_polylepis.2
MGASMDTGVRPNLMLQRAFNGDAEAMETVMASRCSSKAETVASLKSKGCIFGKKELGVSAPVFAKLGMGSGSLTLVNLRTATAVRR